MPIFNAFLAGAQAQQAQESFNQLTNIGMQGLAQNAPIQAALQAQERQRQQQLEVQAERQQRFAEIDAKNRQQLEIEKARQQNKLKLEDVKAKHSAARKLMGLQATSGEKALDRTQATKQFTAREKRLAESANALEADRKAKLILSRERMKAEANRFSKAMDLKKITLDNLRDQQQFIRDVKDEQMALARNKEERAQIAAQFDQDTAPDRKKLLKKQIQLMAKKLKIDTKGLKIESLLTTLMDPFKVSQRPGEMEKFIAKALRAKAELEKQQQGGAGAKTNPFPVEDRANFDPQQFPSAPPIPQEKLVKGTARHAASEAGDVIDQAENATGFSAGHLSYRDVPKEELAKIDINDDTIDPDVRIKEIHRRLKIISDLAKKRKITAKTEEISRKIESVIDSTKSLGSLGVKAREPGTSEQVADAISFTKDVGVNIGLTTLKLWHFLAENAAALEKLTGRGLEKLVGQDINTKKPSFFGKVAENIKNLDESLTYISVGGDYARLAKNTTKTLESIAQLGERVKKVTGKDFINTATLRGIIGAPLSGESTKFAALFAPVTLLAEATVGEPTFGGPDIPKAVPLFGGLPLIDTAVMLIGGVILHKAFKKKKPGLTFEDSLQRHGLSLPEDRGPGGGASIFFDPAFNTRVNQLSKILGVDITEFLDPQKILELEKSPEGQANLLALVRAASDAWVKVDGYSKSFDVAKLKLEDAITPLGPALDATQRGIVSVASKLGEKAAKRIEGVTGQVARRKTQKAFKNLNKVLENKAEELPTVGVPSFADSVKQELGEKAILAGDYPEAIRLGHKDAALSHFKAKVKLAILAGDRGEVLRLSKTMGKESHGVVRNQLLDHLMQKGISFTESRKIVVRRLNGLRLMNRFKAVGVNLNKHAFKLVENTLDVSEALATLSSHVVQNLFEQGRASLAIRVAKNFQALITTQTKGKRWSGKLTKEAAKFLLKYEEDTGVKLGALLGKDVSALNNSKFRTSLIMSTDSPLINYAKHKTKTVAKAKEINTLLERGDWETVAKDIPNIEDPRLRKATVRVVNQIAHTERSLVNGKLAAAYRLAKRIKNARIRAQVQALIDDVTGVKKATPEQRHNIAKKGNIQKTVVDAARHADDIKKFGKQVATELNSAPKGITLENALDQARIPTNVLKKKIRKYGETIEALKKKIEVGKKMTPQELEVSKKEFEDLTNKKNRLEKELKGRKRPTLPPKAEERPPTLEHPPGLLTADTVFFDTKPMNRVDLASFARKENAIASKGYTFSGRRSKSFTRKFMQEHPSQYDLYYNPLEKDPWIIAEKGNTRGAEVAKKRGYKPATSEFIFTGGTHINIGEAVAKLEKTGVVRTSKVDIALSLFSSRNIEGHLFYNKEAATIKGRAPFVFTKDLASEASLSDVGYSRVVRPRDYYQPLEIARSLERGKVPVEEIKAAQKNHAVVLPVSLLPIPYDFFIKAYGYTSRVVQSIFKFDYRQIHEATKDFIKGNTLSIPKNPQAGLLELQKYKLTSVNHFLGELTKGEVQGSYFLPIDSPSFVIPTIQSAIAQAHFKFVRTANQLRVHAGAVLRTAHDLETIVAKLRGQEHVLIKVGTKEVTEGGLTKTIDVMKAGPRIKLSLHDRLVYEYVQELITKVTEGNSQFEKVKRTERFPKLMEILEDARGEIFTDSYRALDASIAFALRKRYLEPTIGRGMSAIEDLIPNKRVYAEEYLKLVKKGPLIGKLETAIRGVATRGFLWGPNGLNFARKNMFQTVTHDLASNPIAFMKTVITGIRDFKAFKARSKQLGFIKDLQHIYDLADESGAGKDIKLKGLKQLDSALWFAAQGTESYNRGFSGHVGLFDGLTKGLKGEALIDHAHRWIADHHYESGILDRAPIFSKSVYGRAANFFSQYGIKDMEFVYKKAIGHKTGLVTMGLAMWAVSELNSTVGLSSAYLAAGIPYSGAIGQATGLAKVSPIFAGEGDFGWSSVAISLLGRLASKDWEGAASSLLTMVPFARAAYSAKVYWGVPDNGWVVNDPQRMSITSRSLKWLKQSHFIAFGKPLKDRPYEKLKFGEWALRLSGFTTELQQYERIAQRAIREAQDEAQANSRRVLLEFPKKDWWEHYETLLEQYYDASEDAEPGDKVWRQFKAIGRLPWYLKLDPLGWLVEVRKKQSKDGFLDRFKSK